MDRTTPIIVSFVSYMFSAFVISKLFHPPSQLTLKEQKDFFGQHLSILHAYCAIIGSSIAYLIEDGINYNAPTNQLHIIVLGVI